MSTKYGFFLSYFPIYFFPFCFTFFTFFSVEAFRRYGRPLPFTEKRISNFIVTFATKFFIKYDINSIFFYSLSSLSRAFSFFPVSSCLFSLDFFLSLQNANKITVHMRILKQTSKRIPFPSPFSFSIFTFFFVPLPVPVFSNRVSLFLCFF